MIQSERVDDVLTLTIDRADKANSLTREMLNDLADHVENAGDAKVLILTGNGRVFSAGADLAEAVAGLAIDPVWERLSGAIARFDGFSIAALNGTLAGGAFGMALACDLRISVPTAKFFYPVMKLGFLPQPSDPVRMRALIGPSRTKLILMAGQKIRADDALAFGLIDRIVSIDDFHTTLETLTQDVIAASPQQIAGIKRLVDE
ncbi:enoyl-CoA hydratase/isomerase family protein [Rhodobacteraceae bacterium HTCC2150]|nr:enoyl-CoA hydratase/isomerase family protein [Rhodobacteraceae bacterium HTCC2150]